MLVKVQGRLDNNSGTAVRSAKERETHRGGESDGSWEKTFPVISGSLLTFLSLFADQPFKRLRGGEDGKSARTAGEQRADLTTAVGIFSQLQHPQASKAQLGKE